MTEYLPGMENERRDPALSQWYTPPDLADRIVRWALELYDAFTAATMFTALEPSAGRGAIARALRERVKTVDCIDIDKRNADELFAQGFPTHCGNFLEFAPASGPYDIAVMNPPFEGGQTEAHVLHALKFCKRVVCHCPLTTLAGQDRYKSLWSKACLKRLVIHSARPSYGAEGGKTEMCTIDVVPVHAGLPGVVAASGVNVDWWL